LKCKKTKERKKERKRKQTNKHKQNKKKISEQFGEKRTLNEKNGILKQRYDGMYLHFFSYPILAVQNCKKKNKQT